MTRVCDIRDAGTLAALCALCAQHHKPLHYLGPTLDGRPVYVMLHAGVEWVAAGTDRDDHPVPSTWHSPLERTPMTIPVPPRPAEPSDEARTATRLADVIVRATIAPRDHTGPAAPVTHTQALLCAALDCPLPP